MVKNKARRAKARKAKRAKRKALMNALQRQNLSQKSGWSSYEDLRVAGADSQKDHRSVRSISAVSQQDVDCASTSSAVASGSAGPGNEKLIDHRFKNFKERKRLQHTAKQNKTLNTQNSIGKKCKVHQSPQVRRKSEFLTKTPQKSNALPKPKFYTPQKKMEKPDPRLEDTEEGEIIETSDDIDSSNDSDKRGSEINSGSASNSKASNTNSDSSSNSDESETNADIESMPKDSKSNKRLIIIDGTNVAYAHGNFETFSAEGIQYCLQYFEKMGHKVKAVIPSFRLEALKSSNPGILEQLYKEGNIVLTPCKNIQGHKCMSYDDRMILQLAYQCNAAVISNDYYRDLIDESPAFKEIVCTRVIGYAWCDDLFMLPKDPYGRRGPTLDQILHC